MPMYDFQCQSCGISKESLEKTGTNEVICECGHTMERYWSQHAHSVIGDEIDVTIKHGLCNEDGSPRRFTSREELKRESIRRGWSNVVEHKPLPGTDKSKHTQRWV